MAQDVHRTCRGFYAWVEQTRPGGVIVLPWHPGFGAGHALRLEVQSDGTAQGRVVGGAAYMMMRSQRVRPDAEPGHGRRRYWTALDPRALDDLSAGADLAITGQRPTAGVIGVRSGHPEPPKAAPMSGQDRRDQSGEWRLVAGRPFSPGSARSRSPTGIGSPCW